MKKYFLILIFLFVSVSFAQLQTRSIKKLPIPTMEQWSNARFAPSGNEIYFTNSEYNGIWQYSFKTQLLKEITRDKHSGFDFSISEDGSKIAYRRTVVEGDHLTRVQESVEHNLKTSTIMVKATGNSVATPVFVKNNLVSPDKISKSLSKAKIQSISRIIGIEETKIAVLMNNEKVLFDPLKNGQYIWPQLSPDGKKIVAVEMDRGAFITDLGGENIIRIGKCNAPQWTQTGKWIIGMDDKDDGHYLLSSDIIAVSIHGNQRINLTQTFNGIAMYPACSPIENLIVFSTTSGEIYLLNYEEVK